MDFINKIRDLDKDIMKKSKERMDSLIKPIGSLGVLEDIAIQISGITGKVKNNINKKVTILMCSDNGVCEEGVASAPQIVTKTQTENFNKGITGVGALSKVNNSDLRVVDIGVLNDVNSNEVVHKKIRRGTWNIAKGPAMTRDEAVKAINIGFEQVRELVEAGYNLIGTGEMGIGNTSSTSAMLIVLSDSSIDKCVGKGAGLTDEALIVKRRVIKKAVELNNPNPNDPIEILYKLGGFDIAGLVGVFLGAAYFRVPVVIDGYISVVAALTASRINPLCKKFMIPSHVSKEEGYNIAIKELGLKPILNLEMRLGEGSGCPLAFNIIESALSVMNNMATFEQGKIDKKDYEDLWSDEE